MHHHELYFVTKQADITETTKQTTMGEWISNRTCLEFATLFLRLRQFKEQ